MGTAFEGPHMIYPCIPLANVADLYQSTVTILWVYFGGNWGKNSNIYLTRVKMVEIIMMRARRMTQRKVEASLTGARILRDRWYVTLLHILAQFFTHIIAYFGTVFHSHYCIFWHSFLLPLLHILAQFFTEIIASFGTVFYSFYCIFCHSFTLTFLDLLAHFFLTLFIAYYGTVLHSHYPTFWPSFLTHIIVYFGTVINHIVSYIGTEIGNR